MPSSNKRASSRIVRIYMLTDDIKDWKKVAAILREAIPQIDQALSQANVPISARKLKAFDMVRDTMLQVSDYEAFFLSQAYGRFLIIIEDWYRNRYGGAVDDDKDGVFVSMLLVHGTPFAMRVPKAFKTSTDEPTMVWIGFPASVQAEEDPLSWIQSRGVVGAGCQAKSWMLSGKRLWRPEIWFGASTSTSGHWSMKSI